MSQFTKLIIDGRVINLPKKAKVLKRHLKTQGARRAEEYIRLKVLEFRNKYKEAYVKPSRRLSSL